MANPLPKAKKPGREAIPDIPFDDEPLTPEDEAAIEEGRRALREGRYVTLEEWKRELASIRNRARSKRR